MADFATLQELTAEVYQVVGLVAGTGVQTYSEPQVHASINTMFDILFKKRYWEWLSGWDTYTLAGANGLLNADISTVVKSHDDIMEVKQANSEQKIFRPLKHEHLRATGSDPLYYVPIRYGDANFATRVIRFYPLTATGSVVMFTRTKPAKFVAKEDVVPFPRVVIAQGAAWNMLAKDGINPPAAQTAQLLYDISYQDLVKAQSDDSIGAGARPTRVPFSIQRIQP